MPQSNFIIGALFLAFVIFITAKGELRTYLGFFSAKQSGGSTSLGAGGAPLAGLSGASLIGNLANSIGGTF